MKSVYCSSIRSCLIPRQRWSLLAGWRFSAPSVISHRTHCSPSSHSSPGRTLSTATAAAATPVSVPSQAAQQQPTSRSNALASQAHAKQTVDYTALAACCHELSQEWVPAKVEEVVQPDPYTLSLRLRTPLSTSWLHLSWHPVAARVALGAPPPRGATSEAFTLVEQVGSALRGLVLTRAALAAPWERVVALDFAPRLTDPPAKRLMCEVMAKFSNVVLTDDQGVVVVAAHQVGGAMSRLRQVQQGRPYQLPPPAAGLPPDPQEGRDAWRSNLISTAQAAVAQAAAAAAAASNGDVAGSSGSKGRKRPRPSDGASEPGSSSNSSSSLPAGSVQAALVRSYQAVSPSLAQELCEAVGVSPASSPEQLVEGQWDALYNAWRQWQQCLANSSFSPSSCSSTGRFSMLGAYPQQHASAHALLDTYYSSLQAADLHTSLHQRLSAAVGNALKKARGRVYSFNQQLQAAEQVDAVQKQADLIMANVYRWPAGELSITAEDWDSGEAVTLTVPDKDTTPVAAAEALYKKARKLRRATDALAPLLEAAQGEVEYLEQLESDVAQLAAFEGMADLRALREVQEELVEAKLIKPPAEAGLAAKAAVKGKQAAKKQQRAANKKGSGSGPAAAAAAAAAGGLGCREFVTPSGLQVLVGRNNKQNDVLSLQIANPQDLWMHVRGIPGSHCVLRLPNKGAEPSHEDVQFAANLAAYFSKARDSTKVDVLVTRAEHVKKLKGGKPGQVLVTKETWGGVMARPGDAAALPQQQEAA